MKVHLFGGTSSTSCTKFTLKKTAQNNKAYFNLKTIQTAEQKCFSYRLSLRKRQETKFSHTEWGTWVRARMLVSCSVTWVSFLFLPDSATVLFVSYVNNSALIRSYRVMPPKSRATQHLLAHNVSPARESRGRGSLRVIQRFPP